MSLFINFKSLFVTNLIREEKLKKFYFKIASIPLNPAPASKIHPTTFKNT